MAKQTTLTKDELVELTTKLRRAAEGYMRESEQLDRRRQLLEVDVDTAMRKPESPLNTEDTWELMRLVQVERDLLQKRQELQACRDSYERLEAEVRAHEQQVDIQRRIVNRIIQGPHVFPESA